MSLLAIAFHDGEPSMQEIATKAIIEDERQSDSNSSPLHQTEKGKEHEDKQRYQPNQVSEEQKQTIARLWCSPPTVLYQ